MVPNQSRRLRVLHVVASLSAAWGGPAAALRSLAPALADFGVDCTVATTALRQSLQRGSARGHPSQEKGDSAAPTAGVVAEAFPLGWAAPIWAAHSPRLRDYLHQALGAGRFDLVHVHELWHYASFAAGAAARRHRMPWVLSLRGALNEWPLRRNWKKRLYLRLVQRALIESARGVHALTDAEAESLRLLGLKVPVLVAPNGVALPGVESGGSAGFAWQPALQGKDVLLFLGRLHRMKGVNLLLSAFARLAPRFPNAVLLIVGPDEAGTRQRMERTLAQAGLAQRAIFTGVLDGAAKTAALAAADVFVLPSYTEGFSNAILEAMAASLPVVISTQCHFPDVATAGAGHVVATDSAAIECAVGRLLQDPAGRCQMGRKGRALVAEQYAWEQVAAAMSDWYRSILADRGRPPLGSG